MCVGGFRQLLPPQRVAAITHIVIEHTRSNAFCLDFIFFLLLLLLLLLLLCSSCFWLVCLLPPFFSSCASLCFWLRSRRHKMQNRISFSAGMLKRCCCFACCCCYWECYNIVEACNILPRIRVGIHPVLSHSLTYSFSCVCACVL